MPGKPYEQAKVLVYDETGLGLVLVRSWYVNHRIGGQDLIGGEIENETPEDTALREGKEEAGVVIHGLRRLTVDRPPKFTPEEFECVTYFFTGLVEGERPEINTSIEHEDAVLWLQPERMIGLNWPA